MNQLCKVCGEPAAGFHFGAFTCEGCKSFFGRTYNNIAAIAGCRNNGNCVINKKNRTNCKSCRLRKCFMVGMSKSGSRYGRRSNWFKIHCLMQEQQQHDQLVQQQQQQQQQLQAQTATNSVVGDGGGEHSLCVPVTDLVPPTTSLTDDTPTLPVDAPHFLTANADFLKSVMTVPSHNSLNSDSCGSGGSNSPTATSTDANAASYIGPMLKMNMFPAFNTFILKSEPTASNFITVPTSSILKLRQQEEPIDLSLKSSSSTPVQIDLCRQITMQNSMPMDLRIERNSPNFTR